MIRRPGTVSGHCYQVPMGTSVDKAYEYMLLAARLIDRLRFE